jgi:hypothetical protein
MNSAEHDHLTSISPWMGIIPRSLAGRLFLLWATANVILTLIPVFTTWMDNTEMVLNTAPTTIFYSFVAFFSNCTLGVAFYVTRAIHWAKSAE